MKKNILATVLLSGLALAAFSTTSSAAEDANGHSVETSKVEVNLTGDGGHEVGSGPFKDKLAIVHKPTLFKFSGAATNGSLNLDNENAHADTQFISVNDDRKGADGKFTFGTWKLEGKLSNLTGNAGTLPAKMVFNTEDYGLKAYDIGTLRTVNGVEDYGPNSVEDGTATGGKVLNDVANYNLKTSFELIAGGDAENFLSNINADATNQDAARGVVTNLGNVKLAIATGDAETAGSYTGTITWTLSPA